MESLRSSKFVKAVCLAVAFSLTYLSCSPETITFQNGCTVIAHDFSTPLDIPNTVETLFEVVTSVQDQENHPNIDSLIYEFFPRSQDATNALYKANAEMNNYSSLGFSGYVQNQADISSGIKDYMLSYEVEIDSFILSTHPDLNQFSSFIQNKISNLTNSSLCATDQALMERYLLSSLGFAQYYYNNFLQPGSFTSLEARAGCDFWEGLACGALATLVGVIVAAFVVWGIMSGGINKNGEPQQLGHDDRLTLAQFGFFTSLITIGISIYAWCCGEDNKDQTCHEISGHMITPLGCNEYKLIIFGKSNYTVTKWDNENTDPGEATTLRPSLTFSVPNPNNPVEIHATKIYCSEGINQNFYNYTYGPVDLGLLSTTNVFPLEWVAAPPTSFTLESGSHSTKGMRIENSNIFYASVNTPSNNNYQYIWEVSAPHEISSNANNALIELVSTGLVTTKVTVTDLCANYSETIQATTNVQ